MGILGFLINALIFSLPLGVVFRLTPFPNVSIYPYDVIAGLIFLVFLFQIIIRKKKILAKKIFVLIYLFLLIGFTSLIINSQYLSFQNFLVSLAYLVRYAAYVSIIFAFQFLSKEFKASINNKLIIAGSIFVILGFVQYLYYPALRNLYYLGWDEHLYRLFSTFLDPNFAGAFLVLILILLSENIISAFNRENRKVLVASMIWAITLVAIFLTYSRSAFVMLLTATAVLLIAHKAYRLIFVTLLVLGVSFFIFPNPNIQGLSPLRIASVEARIDSAREALTIFSKNPIIGVGFNAYRYARVRYGLIDVDKTLVSNAGAGTDNSFLFVLATTGIIGFLIFLDFWVNILRVIVRDLHSNIYGRIAIASIAGLLVNTIFINSLFYPPIMAWMFIMIGLALKNQMQKTPRI